MATKAELETELAALRSIIAEQSKALEDDARHIPEEAPEPEVSAKSALEDVLTEHGIETDELGALWTQLSEELEGLTKNKPLVTALAAFALGFVLGRATK